MIDNQEPEFEEFMHGHAEPPMEVSARILSYVQKDLSPSPYWVGAKIYALGIAIGLASLLVCPQFGLAYGPMGHMLHGIFMRFGAAACSALCGALLLSVTTLLILLSLSRAELGVAYQSRHLQCLALALSLLAIFVFLGASVALPFALLWLGGAMLGGMASYRLRHAVALARLA